MTTAIKEAPPEFDPRPHVERVGTSWLVSGWRCVKCDYVSVARVSDCAVCGAEIEARNFGPEGTVWASTCLRVRVPGRTPPMALAYVVLDNGPRVLAHTPGDRPLPVGSRVELSEPTAAGDVAVVAADGGAR